MNTNVDYATTYFKYPIPTPINGKPTNKSVKKLKTELRANSSSVDTDLGGGDHRYLWLILTDAEYARINPTPTTFTAPVFHGVLTIDSTATITSVAPVYAKERYHEVICIYIDYNRVEQALLRYTQNVVKYKHVKHLINEDTGLIEDDLPLVV